MPNHPQPWRSTARKTVALTPLLALSWGWTVMLTASSAGVEAGAPEAPPLVLPAPETITAPGSVTRAADVPLAVGRGAQSQVASTASADGIPAVALTAYQGAAQVIDAADPGCHLAWPLVAAIGRVESDHGRYAGNVLSEDGVSRPGVFGVPLDGRHGTQRVLDTDDGQYDGDKRFDRAVGPMQFIPSTWSVVGVDADGDSRRDPQDINDASLASAVYLCSGNADLGNARGAAAAVYRYNHSPAYVGLVLAIAQGYAAGGYTAVPNGLIPGATFQPISHAASAHPAAGHGPRRAPGQPDPVAPADQDDAAASPSSPSDGGSTHRHPSRQPGQAVSGAVAQVPAVAATLQQATAYCQEHLTNDQLAALGGVQFCAQAVVAGGHDALTRLLASLSVDQLVDSLLPASS